MAFFIAVLAILPALYAILPRPKQLDLGLRLSWFDRFLVLLTALFLLGLEFHDFLVARYRIFWHRLPSGITSTNLSEVAVLALALVLWIRVRFARLTRSRLEEFSVLAQELLWSGSGAELVALVEDHLCELFRMIRGESVSDRLIEQIDSAGRSFLYPDWKDILSELADNPAPRKRHRSSQRIYRLAAPLRPLLKRLIHWETYQDSLEEITRSILLNESFISSLVRFRPYLGISIIREWRNSRDVFDFQKSYIEALLAMKDSVLYRELRDNQNMDGNRYRIASTNRLLRFFLADANVAFKQADWRLRSESAG